jgi:cholesterol oxidase
MSARLSDPIESLIGDHRPGTIFAAVDVAIVGSGYGGALAGVSLARPGRRVAILERGSEYAPGDFPVDLGQVPGHVRFQRADGDEPVGYPDALFDLRIGSTMDVLVGNGLGGTSLINANVAVEPDRDEFGRRPWPRELRDNRGELDRCFAEASKLLGVSQTDMSHTAKYGALVRLARDLDARCESAPLTVTVAQPGIQTAQPPCTMCGNCVTGCNVGAKKTLMMDALPRAKAQGAELYTGVTVLSVMPTRNCPESHPYRWTLRLRRTASEKTPLADEVFHLAARDVILAAGTLGSTEILMRSRDLHGLKVSDRLGRGFSGNGDAIAFGFGQRHPVHAIGEAVQQGDHAIGPTISGIVRTGVSDRTGRWQKLTIEDASVPTSLGRIFGELLTTGAFFHGLQTTKLPAWFRKTEDGSRADPLTVAPGAIDHSQILLVMGDDGAGGRLRLRRPKGRTGSLDHAQLVVHWPSVGSNPALLAAHELLERSDRGPGFDGGQYVPNPFWRLLPEEASSVMSGAPPGGRAITVHPLGGCGMADDIRAGVVNHQGEVFDGGAGGDGTQVHEGLHVLDGAIIPKALGINPLLTIAALSWRAAERLRIRRYWEAADGRSAPLARQRPAPIAIREHPVATAAPQDIELGLREQLIGKVTQVPQWLKKIDGRVDRWAQDKGLILRLEMTIPDLDGWLAAGTDTPLETTAELHVNPMPADVTTRLHQVHIPDEHISNATLVATGTGKVCLLQRERVGWFKRTARTLSALWTYMKRRRPFRHGLPPIRKDPDDAGTQRIGSVPARIIDFARRLPGVYRVAWHHAQYRRLHYRLDFGQGPRSFTLEGEKRLAWQLDQPRLWNALLNLPFTLSRASATADEVNGSLEMDMTYVVTTGAPQVKTSPHLPATVVALSRLGMLFARAILQTHFWEFAAPEYPKNVLRPPTESPPLNVGGQPVRPELDEFRVPLYKDGPEIGLRLTRYRHAKTRPEPVLLIHGLAQGSLIYSTETLERNMAAAMSEAGFDVWLLDYRLSNMLRSPIRQGGWSMDEIAEYDIPAAVERVSSACGDQPVRIFAHCVGATSVAMALLEGRLKGRVKCVAFNAIHPWTLPSSVNEFRARIGSFFRDVLGRDLLHPIPAPHPSVAQALFDRLAYSVARYADEDGDHERSPLTEDAATVCDRMTFLYGRMWRHRNLDARTHAALTTLVGPGAGDVYRQLYYFAMRERLTDKDGVNRYLTEPNLLANWTVPTFFFHGEESMVFNPESAERSAIRLHAIINEGGTLGKTPVRLLRVPGFGHMDVVFGKDAHKHVYGVLRSFFEDPEQPLGDPIDPRHDIHPRLGLRVTAGPILRAAWLDERRRVAIRLWAETNDEVSAIVDGVRLVGDGIDAVRAQWPVDEAEPRYRMLDARLDRNGAVRFNVRAKVGPGAARTADAMAIPLDRQPPPARYAAVYPESMPWLRRLRAAAGDELPCTDMRFLVGSCRYPGTPFEADVSDAIFHGMMEHIEGRANDAPGVHMLFLIGDQIYADATANIVDSQAWRERYGQRYRDAFTSSHMRKALAHVPTHFAIDDHEIADDWSGGAVSGDAVRRKELAQAERSATWFQSSGRTRQPLDPPDNKRAASELWYALAEDRERCCPAFVMNTRSERKLRSAKADKRAARKGRLPTPRDAELVSREQLAALEKWLIAAKDRWSDAPKFIFCGVGIAPIAREFAACGHTWRSHDAWPGYPGTLSYVLRTILEEEIRHVVFVSGDLHLSSVSRLTIRRKGHDGGRGKEWTVWHVVSSGLYAPMPFANTPPSAYDWNQPVSMPDSAGCSLDITAESGLLCAGQPHYLRLDAQQSAAGWTLSIGIVGADARGTLVKAAGCPPTGVTTAGLTWTIPFGDARAVADR